MGLRFSRLWVPTIVALALTATHADAQVRRTRPTRRIPVQKTAPPAPRVDTVTVTRTDTVTTYVHDTTMVTRYDTVTNTVNVPMTFSRVGGWYVGLGAGTNPTLGHLDNTQTAGWAAQAMFGWDQVAGPFGIRFDGTYNNFITNDLALKNAFETPGCGQCYRTGNPTVLTIGGDVKLNLPWRPTYYNNVKTYVLGGVTWNRYKNLGITYYNGNPDNIKPTQDWNSKWGWQAGGGMQFGIGHRSAIFLEARYVRFNLESPTGNGNDAAYVPITIGFTW